MRYLLFLIFSLGCLAGRAVDVRGTVRDADSGEAVGFATVTAQPGGKAVACDVSGRFYMDLPAGSYTLTVSFVGYKSATHTAVVNKPLDLTIVITEDATLLDEVVVTATEGGGTASSSRIDREAMSHLQPTSFTDLLELLPGNISHTPDMGSANTIKLRETGTLGANGQATEGADYSISSLGTLFVVDGAPMGTDANLQSIPGSDSSQPEGKRDITNRGVDMRTIGTDNIESVEVIRGIPGAEYGNLTSGVVNIKRIRRATPLTARVKVDEYSKLVSLGKGFALPGHDHVINVDGSYLDSKVDPRDNLENYKRLTLAARLNMRWTRSALETGWVAGVDYTGSFDNAKTDPDLSYNRINEYRSRYRRLAFTSDLNFYLTRHRWLKHINLNTSASYQNDRLTRRRQVSPQRASVAPTTMSEGVHDGQYLLSEYIADFTNDSRPVNVFAKLKADGELGPTAFIHKYKIGVEWTMSKNVGKGQLYDLTRPLSASWTTRPRAYRDIPALNVFSTFVEDEFTARLGDHKVNLQAGLRTIQLLGLADRYALSGKVYLDPRVNIKWDLPGIKVGRRSLQLYLAGGVGMTTKMPTIAYLFPQVHYSDFIQLNYYDVNDPLARSRVNLRTYIDDVTNYNLKAARNTKWEVRLGGKIGKNSFTLTYFNERMNSGYRYIAVYRPYSYDRYDVNAIDATALSGPPSLDDVPFESVKVLNGYRMADNGSRIDKQGIEFTVNTARWRPLATALTITGAWLHTTYTNSIMLYDPVSEVIGDVRVADNYIGYYNYNDGRVNNQFNTNFMFDTQIKRWGLIFSTSVQCMWWVTTRKMWQNGVPEQYLDVADGKLHNYDPNSDNPLLQSLVKTYNEGSYKRQTVPMAMYINLKATKEIGRWLRVAVFANHLIDYLPDYTSNGLKVRRVGEPYFGMELNFTL